MAMGMKRSFSELSDFDFGSASDSQTTQGTMSIDSSCTQFGSFNLPELAPQPVPTKPKPHPLPEVVPPCDASTRVQLALTDMLQVLLKTIPLHQIYQSGIPDKFAAIFQAADADAQQSIDYGMRVAQVEFLSTEEKLRVRIRELELANRNLTDQVARKESDLASFQDMANALKSVIHAASCTPPASSERGARALTPAPTPPPPLTSSSPLPPPMLPRSASFSDPTAAFATQLAKQLEASPADLEGPPPPEEAPGEPPEGVERCEAPPATGRGTTGEVPRPPVADASPPLAAVAPLASRLPHLDHEAAQDEADIMDIMARNLRQDARITERYARRYEQVYDDRASLDRYLSVFVFEKLADADAFPIDNPEAAAEGSIHDRDIFPPVDDGRMYG